MKNDHYADIKPEEVLICIPTRGNPNVKTVVAFQAMRENYPGLPPIFYHAGRIAAVQTRNEIVQMFLEHDNMAKVMIMCDDDIVPSPKMLDGLAPMERFGVLGFPCGFLWFKPEPQLLWTSFSDVPTENTEWERVEKVESVGGCFAIRRDVLEELGPIPFRHEHERMSGEDKLFCFDAREKGFEVAANWNHWSSHQITTSDWVLSYLGHAGVQLPGFTPPSEFNQAVGYQP